MASRQKMLFTACRKGDVGTVRRILENGSVEPNVRDEWDNTPLYLASLCGHLKVLEYLLEHGTWMNLIISIPLRIRVKSKPAAITSFTSVHYDSNSPEGQRTRLAALTDGIRWELKKYAKPGPPKQRTNGNELRDILTRLLNKGIQSDITLKYEMDLIPLHRFVLCSRCPHLGGYIIPIVSSTSFEDYSIDVTGKFTCKDSFYSILEYIYTGKTEISCNFLESLQRDAVKLGLMNLASEAHKHIDQGDTSTGRETAKIGTAASWKSMVTDLTWVALHGIPADLHHVVGEIPSPSFCDIEWTEQMSNYDLIIKGSGRVFYGHKVIFLGNHQSIYFHPLLLAALDMNDSHQTTVVISTDTVTDDALARVWVYFYSGTLFMPQRNSTEELLGLYNTITHLRIDEVKNNCVQRIKSSITDDNVLEILECAERKDQDNITKHCLKFLHDQVEEMQDCSFFKTCIECSTNSSMGQHSTTLPRLINIFQNVCDSSPNPYIRSKKKEMKKYFNQALKICGITEYKIELDSSGIYHLVRNSKSCTVS